MSPSREPAETYQFDGQTVCYEVIGSGAPVVLVHGTPFSSYVWRNIARELARSFRVFSYDLLGYGKSEKRADQDASLGVQNRLLAELLRHWGLERPNIIGHDFGGATTLRTHLIDGRNYERMLLIDPVAMRPWGSPFVQHVLRFEDAFAGLPDYIHRAILRAYIRGAAHKTLTDEDLEPYIAPWVGAVGQAAFYRQIAQMDQRYTDEVQGSYGRLRCPCLLLWGMNDQWIPIEKGRELAELVPGCQLVEIPDCGHLVQEDAPEAIVAAAFRFFGR
jgi:pimeloyl-ACP methyl ester carboxylesterase